MFSVITTFKQTQTLYTNFSKLLQLHLLNAFVFFLYIFEQVGDNLPFEIFPNDANYNARGLYARFDQYEIGATVVANDHGGSGPREVSATNSDFVSDSGTFKATYRPLIAGTYDLFIKLIEDSSLAPVSI